MVEARTVLITAFAMAMIEILGLLFLFFLFNEEFMSLQESMDTDDFFQQYGDVYNDFR